MPHRLPIIKIGEKLPDPPPPNPRPTGMKHNIGFFKSFGLEMNELDMEKAYKIYYSLVRVVGKGLKMNGNIYLPDIGKLEVLDSNFFGRKVRRVKFFCHRKLLDVLRWGMDKK
jgi:hypothetical protein